MRCPYCAAPNQAGAGFCIDCGEPLDAAWAVSHPLRPAMIAAPPAAPLDPPLLRLAHSVRQIRMGREIVLAGVLLVLVLGWDAWNTAGMAARDAQAAALRHGIAAAEAQHWAEAVTDYTAAGDYHDAVLRRAAAQVILDRLLGHWQEAEAGRTAGAWSAATLDYAAVAALQPDYPQVLERLAEARQRAGPVLYRRPAPGAPDLWWAALDGSGARPIPQTDENSLVLGLSPDGRWAVYSTYISIGPGYGTRLTWLLHLPTGAVVPVLLPGTTRPIVLDVVFRGDGSGFWGSVDGALYYADLTASAPTEALLRPCAAHIVARDPQSGTTILLQPPADGGPGGTLYAAADPYGSTPRLLVSETGLVDQVLVSAGGGLLAYRLAQADAPDQLISDHLITVDLRAGTAGAVPRLVVATAPIRTGEDAPPRLGARLLPGSPPRLLITRPGAESQVYDPATASAWSPQTGMAAGWHPAFGSLIGSPGGRWLGLEMWTMASGDPLSRLVMQPTGGGPAWSLLVPGTRPLWLGFSSDERYAFYGLSPAEGKSWIYHLLLSVPTPDGIGGPSAADVTPLIRYDVAAPFLLHDVALTGDGRRLLALVTKDQSSAVPGDPPRRQGLYTLRPDGSDWQLLAAGVREFWVPGGPGWAVQWVP